MMHASTAAAFAPDEPDETLVDRARHGSSAAFETLVVRYQDRVYRLAMRMTGNDDDAEEITQESFLRAHVALATFHGESRFGTWLYRIAMNETLMRRRAAARRPALSLDGLVPRLADVGFAKPFDDDRADDLVDSKRVAVLVRQALDELDESQRAALVLRDLEELPAEHVARILGVSAETVRQRAHRARLRMRELLQP